MALVLINAFLEKTRTEMSNSIEKEESLDYDYGLFVEKKDLEEYTGSEIVLLEYDYYYFHIGQVDMYLYGLLELIDSIEKYPKKVVLVVKAAEFSATVFHLMRSVIKLILKNGGHVFSNTKSAVNFMAGKDEL